MASSKAKLDYLDAVQQGINYIEANLNTDLDLPRIAHESGLSLWHFQRIFKGLTNETVKTYIRSRRLSIALEQLTATDARIIDIALDAGFDSQESFSRAFKRVFGLPPNAARKIRLANPFFKRLIIDQHYIRHLVEKVSAEPLIYVQQAMTIIGMRTTYYGEESEKNNMGSKLPELWARFTPRMGDIRNRCPGAAYGVIEQTSADSELLQYTAGCETPENEVIPDGMESLKLPTTQYARFTHYGPPTELKNTINFIYSSWLMNSDYRHTYAADLVTYGKDYQPNSDNSVIYYAIPID